MQILNFHNFKTEKKNSIFVLSTKSTTVPLLIILLKNKNEMIVSSKILFINANMLFNYINLWTRQFVLTLCLSCQRKKPIKFRSGLIKVKFSVYKPCKTSHGSEGVDKMGFL